MKINAKTQRRKGAKEERDELLNPVCFGEGGFYGG